MTIEYKDSKRIVALSSDLIQTPTYSDDFSGTDDWADQGSGVGVNTTTDRLEFSSWTDNSTNNSSTLDLGSALSDTKWTIRFKLQWTGFSNTTDWTAPAIGMFSASSATAGNSAQDMLFYWSIANGATKRAYLSSADNSTISGTDHNLNLSWVLDTTYYIQLQRDGSSFSATVWTGSYNGTEVASGTDTIGGTVSGLQYFGVKSPVTSRGGSFTGWLDDLQIWNGILATSLPYKPTDVQDNSLLVEKDTGNRYWRTPEASGADTTTTNSNVNDVAHFEGANSANSVIGEQITSGNALIGQAITSLSFWLYKLNSGSSGTETFTFGVWNSSGANVHEFGTVTRGELPQGTAFGNAVKFTKSTGSYVLQTNDILGIRTNSAPASAWTVEVTQRDSDVYSDGQRAIFVQGVTPTTSAKDIGFEVVSNTVTPATWTMEPTMSNDVYGSSSGWDLSSSTDITLDTANEGVTYTDVDETNGIGRSLGLTASTSWVLRLKFELSALNGNDHGLASMTSDHTVQFKNSSLETLTPMVQGASYWRFVLLKNDQGSYVEDTSANNMFSLNTTYYIEIIRDGDTVTETIRTGSHSGSVVDTLSVSGLTSGFTLGLDGIQHWSTSATASETMTGWVRNVEFYNGVTTIN